MSRYRVEIDAATITLLADSLADVCCQIRETGRRIRVWAPSGLLLIDTNLGDQYCIALPIPSRTEALLPEPVYLYCEDLAAGLVGPFATLQGAFEHRDFLKQRGDASTGTVVKKSTAERQGWFTSPGVLQLTPDEDRAADVTVEEWAQ